MSAGVVIDTLFSGPSPALIAAILVLAVFAAAAVVWSLRLLLFDPRSVKPSPDNFSGTPAIASTGDDEGDLTALDL